MTMSERFDKLFERMKLEFKKQTMELTYSLTTNISIKLEEKLKPLRRENQELKSEIANLEKKIEYLERDSKRNNIIIFGLEEKETCVSELLETVRRKLCEDLKLSVMRIDINNIYRVGKRNKSSTKPRPVVVTFVHKWKRNEVLRNKKRFRNVFVSEDFPKDVVEKRRLWLAELKEERKKGNIAYLVYDKLLVKPGMIQDKKNNEVEEEGKKEDFSDLLDGIEQCEKDDEKKPRQRRAKAMINRNKSLSDEDKEDNDEDKPRRRRATATINKKNKSSDEESVGERALENFRRRTMFNKKVNFPNGDSEDDVEKSKTGAIKKTYKKDTSSKEEYGEDKAGAKEKPRLKDVFSEEYVPQKRKMDY